MAVFMAFSTFLEATITGQGIGQNSASQTLGITQVFFFLPLATRGKPPIHEVQNEGFHFELHDGTSTPVLGVRSDALLLLKGVYRHGATAKKVKGTLT